MPDKPYRLDFSERMKLLEMTTQVLVACETSTKISWTLGDLEAATERIYAALAKSYLDEKVNTGT